MQTVLLDTDFAIDYLRGKPAVRDIIIPLWEKNIAFLSLLSIYELYAGMRPREKQATDHFINACRIEPSTMEICKSAGLYRLKHQQKGITLSVVDCLIAETARANHHQIATKNISHYPESQIIKTGKIQ